MRLLVIPPCLLDSSAVVVASKVVKAGHFASSIGGSDSSSSRPRLSFFWSFPSVSILIKFSFHILHFLLISSFQVELLLVVARPGLLVSIVNPFIGSGRPWCLQRVPICLLHFAQFHSSLFSARDICCLTPRAAWLERASYELFASYGCLWAGRKGKKWETAIRTRLDSSCRQHTEVAATATGGSSHRL